MGIANNSILDFSLRQFARNYLSAHTVCVQKLFRMKLCILLGCKLASLAVLLSFDDIMLTLLWHATLCATASECTNKKIQDKFLFACLSLFGGLAWHPTLYHNQSVHFRWNVVK